MAIDLQTVLNDGVAAGDAPFLIGMTGDADGVTWAGAAGECAPGRPASVDSIFRLYSMTKAVGATAAMILIDRGKLDLDRPVQQYMPEIGALQVLEGMDGNVPRLRPPRRPITARHLATHTSGLVYDLVHPQLQTYLEATGRPSYFSFKRAGLDYPLVFDPGEDWGYGIGIDWLGLLVERIDGRSIDQFCQQEIFDPLGMTDTCFELDEARARRLCRFYARGPDRGFTDRDGRSIYTGRADEVDDDKAAKEYRSMGGCLYGTAPDYLRLLRMHLNGGVLDGTRVIGEATTRRLQENLVGDVTIGFDWFPGPKKGHAFGFVRLQEDTPGMRGEGSLYWAGGANGHYWIDIKNNLVGVFVTYSFPFLDPQLMARYAAFERQAYAQEGSLV